MKKNETDTASLVERLRVIAMMMLGEGMTADGHTLIDAATALETAESKYRETFQCYVDANEARIDAEKQITELRRALEEIAAIDIADKGLPASRIARTALGRSCISWHQYD